MAFRLANLSGNRVNFGSNASVDNLTAWTFLLWWKPVDITAEYKGVAAKLRASDYLQGWGIWADSSLGSGVLTFTLNDSAVYDRIATQSQAVWKPQQWQLLGLTVNHAAAVGNDFFRGTIQSPIISVKDASNSSHGVPSGYDDSAQSLKLGATIDSDDSTAYGGDYGRFGFFNRILSLEEMNLWRRGRLKGNIIHAPMRNSAHDFSGSGNNGTLSSAILVQNRPIKSLAQIFLFGSDSIVPISIGETGSATESQSVAMATIISEIVNPTESISLVHTLTALAETQTPIEAILLESQFVLSETVNPSESFSVTNETSQVISETANPSENQTSNSEVTGINETTNPIEAQGLGVVLLSDEQGFASESLSVTDTTQKILGEIGFASEGINQTDEAQPEFNLAETNFGLDEVHSQAMTQFAEIEFPNESQIINTQFEFTEVGFASESISNENINILTETQNPSESQTVVVNGFFNESGFALENISVQINLNVGQTGFGIDAYQLVTPTNNALSLGMKFITEIDNNTFTTDINTGISSTEF